MVDIPLGTPIISEPALFCITDNGTTSNWIPRAEQASMVEFQNLRCPDPITPKNRFQVNSFMMGTDQDGNEIHGIFKQSSRLNHSCRPNAHFAWNSISERLTVHAIDDVPAETEIFISYRYEDYSRTTIQRQQKLCDDYGFNCTCRACDLNTRNGRRSAKRESEMRSIKNAIKGDIGSMVQTSRTRLIGNIRNLGMLLGKEGLVYPQQADLYGDEIQWYREEMERTANGTTDHPGYKEWCREGALQAARKRLDLDIAATGYDSPDVMRTLTLIREVKEE